MGFLKEAPCSTTARLKFGDGRVGGVKRAAEIKVCGIPGRRGAVAAFVLDADIPALLREGALEALGGQLDFEHDSVTLRKHGVEVPLGVNEMGHYVLSVAQCGKGPPCVDRGPNEAASYFE